MPFIQVKVIEDGFSEAQEQDIVGSLTDAMVNIEGEHMRAFTWCVVEEVRSGSGGRQPLTTADVKALAMGAGV